MQQLFETAHEEQSVFVQERVCVCVFTYSWYIASVWFQALGLLLPYMKPIVDTKYLQYYIYLGLRLKLDCLLYVLRLCALCVWVWYALRLPDFR